MGQRLSVNCPAGAGCYDVLQMNVAIAHPPAHNPFTGARLTATFQGEHSRPLAVRGFCDSDDGSIWRLRFCPRRPGAYDYTLLYEDGAGSEEATGSFACHETEKRGFVHIDPAHPYHFVYDNGEHPFLAGKTAWRLGVSPLWREFLEQCAHYRQNVVRCGIEFGSFDFLPGGDVWAWGGHRQAPDFTRFNLALWRRWDEVLAYAASLNILVEPVLFCNVRRDLQPPPIPDPDMERYWDYAIARLGAYPNLLLWELYNEFVEHPDYQAYMARYLTAHDPYGRLVTTSGREVGEVPFPHADWNELIAPHFCVGSWHHLHGFYHDWATKLHTYGKPVYIDETGRAIESQNNTDGIHRRKQYWIWAIAGDYCNYHSQGGCYTDLSLEPGEEFWPAYVSFWEQTRWWEMVPTDERVLVTPPGALASYCLWSPRATIVYAYSNRSGTDVPANTLWLHLDAGQYGVRYYHPQTGDWDKGPTIEHVGGPLSLALPSFRDDLAVCLDRE